MRKQILILSIIFSLVLGFQPVFAAKPDSDSVLPEEDGTYDVPGHANLKLKVIVHRARPTPGPTPYEECYLPDPSSGAVVDKAGWHLPSSAFSYAVNPASAPASIGSADFSTLTTNAFKTWTDELGQSIDLVQGADTTKTKASLDGTNLVTFGRTSGSALGITYIWYDRVSGVVTELDTILNLKFSWAWSDPSTWLTDPGTVCAYQYVYDAQDVLTHELGHWVGLNDEYASNYVNNTMYGYGSKGDAKADTLTQGDIAGLAGIHY